MLLRQLGGNCYKKFKTSALQATWIINLSLVCMCIQLHPNWTFPSWCLTWCGSLMCDTVPAIEWSQNYDSNNVLVNRPITDRFEMIFNFLSFFLRNFVCVYIFPRTTTSCLLPQQVQMDFMWSNECCSRISHLRVVMIRSLPGLIQLTGT